MRVLYPCEAKLLLASFAGWQGSDSRRARVISSVPPVPPHSYARHWPFGRALCFFFLFSGDACAQIALVMTVARCALSLRHFLIPKRTGTAWCPNGRVRVPIFRTAAVLAPVILFCVILSSGISRLGLVAIAANINRNCGGKGEM